MINDETHAKLDGFDGEDGLAATERVFGLTANGSVHGRVEALVSAVRAKLDYWESLSPSKLIQEHDALDALFRIKDKGDLVAAGNRGRVFRCWWTSFFQRLWEENLAERAMDEIHRETRALFTREVAKDERSLGGRMKAAKERAEPNPHKDDAIKMARAHPDLSATQIKMRLRLKASERTIRGWIASVRQ